MAPGEPAAFGEALVELTEELEQGLVKAGGAAGGPLHLGSGQLREQRLLRQSDTLSTRHRGEPDACGPDLRRQGAFL